MPRKSKFTQSFDVPAAAPLPALGRVAALAVEVAVALGEVARGAGLGHHVDHAGARHRVQEGCLLRA